MAEVYRVTRKYCENRNTMYRTLNAVVEWLDREIETLNECSPDYFWAAQIDRLEELRDDLAETVRQVDEGGR